jgi:hypothetical protein
METTYNSKFIVATKSLKYLMTKKPFYVFVGLKPWFLLAIRIAVTGKMNIKFSV